MAHATSRHGSYDHRCNLKLLEDGRWEATVVLHWDDTLSEAAELLLQLGFATSDITAYENVRVPRSPFKHASKFRVIGGTDLVQRLLQDQYDDHGPVLKA